MKPKQKQPGIVIAVAAIAIIAVVAVIVLSGPASATRLDYSSIPSERASDGAFVLGDPDAPVTIVEFADFACPHCVEYNAEILRFVREYVATGRARFEYRMYATNAGGAQTVFAGQLAECIDEADPGAFWDAHDILFELGGTGAYFGEDMGRIVAQRAGATNYSELLACSQDANQIDIDMDFGQAQGVAGTPAVMVRFNNGPVQWIRYNGVTYDRGSVPYDVLAAIVENYS
jgi:protein-disulfide isomerase